MDARRWNLTADPKLDAQIRRVDLELHRARVDFGTGRLSADDYVTLAESLNAQLAILGSARLRALVEPGQRMRWRKDN
jgi:hypothetical protein